MSHPDQLAGFAAVDLGASSGRVIVGRVGREAIDLSEVHRFANTPVSVGGVLHWDILNLYAGVLDGLRAAGRVAGQTAGRIRSVGIDSWAVDYGLLDASGALLGNPVHYRDARTDGVPERAYATVPPDELYARTGIQHAPFNTIHQFLAARGTPQFAAARRALLIPDLLAYWLTGQAGTELTNASTTQLLDPATGQWADDVARRLGIDTTLFPALREPGDHGGFLRDDVLIETGLTGPVALTAVGSHDTASAVVGVPARDARFAYISSGTWSLVGLELDEPVRTEDSRRANFTNELGVDGTIRYLRNIMGHWLLQECMRQWTHEGRPQDLTTLLAAAADVPPLGSIIDAGDPGFLAPGDMPRRIAKACAAAGDPAPGTPAELARCIFDSLALAHREAITDAQRLSGRGVDTVHIVGGGARNALLCQATADACGLPVVAGPVEAAALGNILVQARSHGAVRGSLAELRSLIRHTQALRTYSPRGTRAWDAAAQRLAARRARRPAAITGKPATPS
ncbi:rhamnulokinase [Embleya scabrispora]|uniref:rhamnulokinase n=1 Tax=Embleya scabrispora TaxID=159449 RepID=UPI0003751635|nr:rhamnulokinase family protein [Embleya scabrispora]MYS81498.1 rhamnulokinase [Streptomyces sp. SID5474]